MFFFFNFTWIWKKAINHENSSVEISYECSTEYYIALSRGPISFSFLPPYSGPVNVDLESKLLTSKGDI